MALFIDYRQKKDKKRAAKAGVVISAFLILLNAIPPLYTNFFQEERDVTRGRSHNPLLRGAPLAMNIT